LEVRFNDGLSGAVDLSGRLFGTVFEPLKDPDVFAQVTVDEFGAVCWPNGADLAPDALYRDLRAAQDANQPGGDTGTDSRARTRR